LPTDAAKPELATATERRRVTQPLTVAPGKGERTRRRLLDIAVRRFAADGFRRTSVSDIAREAGLTPAAAYAYFAGKDGLFQAAVDADASALIEAARSAGARGTSARDQLFLFVAELRERVDDHPLARRVLSGFEPEVAARLVTIPSLVALTDGLAEELAEAQESGEVRRDVDPAELAVGLETIVLALLMAELQTGLTVEPERKAGVLAAMDAALRPPA
jgi:AcrR family transcriptional regulator